MELARAAKVGVCVAALALGAGLRLWASTLGGNYDIESFWLVAQLVEAGKHVYIETDRMPYAPGAAALFALALQVERGLGFDGLASFHVVLAGLLTLADLAIALTLARAYGWAAAVAFALNPVSILITGYHTQIDTLAILFGLWSWRLLESPAAAVGWRAVVPAALLLGLSLTTKHVFALFPLWVLAASSRPLAQRALYGAFAYTVFAAAFLPFVYHAAGLAAVREHVFAYRGGFWYANALIVQLIPSGAWATRAFLAVMVAAGVLVGRAAPRAAFCAYLVLLVALSPTIANQYLAIPLVACAVHWKNPLGWLYAGLATVALLGSPDNVGTLPPMRATAAHLRELGLVLAPAPHSSLWPQLCLLFFIASWPIASLVAGGRAGRAARSVGR